MKAWAWTGQYLIAMVMAAMLGSILGGMQLFRETGIGATGLTAPKLVRCLACGSALVLFWLVGGTAAGQIPEDGKGLSSAGQVMEPLVTLIVVIVGHRVLLLVVGPFLEETGRTAYNWILLFGTVGAALRMVSSGYRSSAWWIEELGMGRRPAISIPSGVLSTWSQCGAAVRADMRFCGQCGQGLGAARCRQCGHSLATGEKFCGARGQPAG